MPLQPTDLAIMNPTLADGPASLASSEKARRWSRPDEVIYFQSRPVAKRWVRTEAFWNSAFGGLRARSLSAEPAHWGEAAAKMIKGRIT